MLLYTVNRMVWTSCVSSLELELSVDLTSVPMHSTTLPHILTSTLSFLLYCVPRASGEGFGEYTTFPMLLWSQVAWDECVGVHVAMCNHVWCSLGFTITVSPPTCTCDNIPSASLPLFLPLSFCFTCIFQYLLYYFTFCILVYFV